MLCLNGQTFSSLIGKTSGLTIGQLQKVFSWAYRRGRVDLQSFFVRLSKN
jgi:hypothetical protein